MLISQSLSGAEALNSYQKALALIKQSTDGLSGHTERLLRCTFSST